MGYKASNWCNKLKEVKCHVNLVALVPFSVTSFLNNPETCSVHGQVQFRQVSVRLVLFIQT